MHCLVHSVFKACACTSMCIFISLFISILMQVYRCLQRMLLCLSHQQTLSILDKLGENHDEKVKVWQSNIECSFEKVCMSFYIYRALNCERVYTHSFNIARCNFP